MPEWLLTALAFLVGAVAAYLERRGKKKALEVSETITRQLTAVIEGVEKAGAAQTDGAGGVKLAVRRASERAGIDKLLAERVKLISGLMK